MKRLGTMLALIVAVGLIAASSALADVRAPGNSTWTGIAPGNASWTGVPTSSKTWGTKVWDVRRPSDVRQGARGWARVAPRSWSDGSRPT